MLEQHPFIVRVDNGETKDSFDFRHFVETIFEFPPLYV